MRTHFEFRSTAFPAYEGEADEINPGRHGRRLAEFFAAELPKHGFPVRTIGAEDWGWMVELQHDEFPLWVGCGNVDDSADEYLCFIEPSRPTVRKWLKTIDTRATVEKLAAALDGIVRGHADTRELRWLDEGETPR